MSARRAGPWLSTVLARALFALVALFAASCATAPAPRPGAGFAPGKPCVDASFRGRFEDPREDEKRSFRLRARICPRNRITFEVRGTAGGPVLVAAVREDLARVLLPKERSAATGPDTPVFWQRWTGLPLSGGLLAGGGSSRVVGDWSVALSYDDASRWVPTEVLATRPDGGRVELRRTDLRETEEPFVWPTVPRGFDHFDGGVP